MILRKKPAKAYANLRCGLVNYSFFAEMSKLRVSLLELYKVVIQLIQPVMTIDFRS